jgi:hypothetical protein
MRDPTTDPRYLAGLRLQEQKRFAEAVTEFEKSGNEGNPLALIELMNVYWDLGDEASTRGAMTRFKKMSAHVKG